MSRPSTLHRIWRLPALPALLLALPVQIAALTFCWRADATYRDYIRLAEQRAAATPGPTSELPPFDLEQWRYFARDAGRRLLAEFTAPSPPSDGTLDVLDLLIAQHKVSDLDRDLPASGKTDTKKAVLQTPEGAIRVRARYAGDNHWHWLYPQKSWRIKVRKDGLWRGRSVFTLKNPPSIWTVDECVATDVARATGLLAPEVRPVQLHVNGRFMGLYRFADVADESLLRRSRRMPGSIYSGDGAPVDAATGISALFDDSRHWRKDASRNAEQSDDRGDIDALLSCLGEDDPMAFAAFAAANLDVDQFARFCALDRAFASVHHDYHHNHKLYVDPYRGRFEPIMWDLSDWMLGVDDDRLDLALNPLLIALRAVPTIEHRMLEVLHELLDGPLRPDRIASRVRELHGTIRPTLAADGRRDRIDHDPRYLDLPMVATTHFAMDDYDEAIAALPLRFATRHERLREMLDDCRVRLHHQPRGGVLLLQLVSDGIVAGDWTSLSLTAPTGHDADQAVELIADRDRNGRIDASDPVIARAVPSGDRLVLTFAERLYPGLARFAAIRGNPLLHGGVDLATAALTYDYFLRGVGPAVAIDERSLQLDNAITGAPVSLAGIAAGAAPTPAADLASCHPWRLPPTPPARTIELGPGEVRVDATLDLRAEVTLRVRAGTTLLLGPGASILCRGPTFVSGSATAPVRFRAADADRPWGCFSLHGPGTAGSRIEHAAFEGGGGVDVGLVQMTGMVDIGVTHDIAVRDCRFGANATGDDAAHFAYVRDSSVVDCTFEGAPSDGFDLDLCDGVEITGCSFVETGNDGLDLMTCDVTVRDCRFDRCGDKGVSVGEGTRLELLGSTWSGCVMGIQIKDESHVRADRMELAGCRVGVGFLHKNLRYAAGGSLTARSLHFDDVDVPVAEAEGFTLTAATMFVDGRRRHP